MARAVDHYLGVCRTRGEEPDRPFSGRFNTRFGSALHRQIAIDAALKNESINDWLVKAAQRRWKRGTAPNIGKRLRREGLPAGAVTSTSRASSTAAMSEDTPPNWQCRSSSAG
jgi:hypothetical protein